MQFTTCALQQQAVQENKIQSIQGRGEGEGREKGEGRERGGRGRGEGEGKGKGKKRGRERLYVEDLERRVRWSTTGRCVVRVITFGRGGGRGSGR